MIDRPNYLNKIELLIDKPIIKVLTGIRRSGKSTLLKILQNHLLIKGVSKSQILYVNFESLQFINIRDSQTFYRYVLENINRNDKVYLFFDEIQWVDRWEEAINSFLVDLDSDIYITGSNSNMLSSELSTLLTGRYVEFKILPLTYSEMIMFHKDLNIASNEERIWKYIRRGGFPSVNIADYDETTCYMIINDIYDSIVLRDVVQRFNIRNVELLNRIVKYIIDNTGNTFSAKSVSDYFKSQNRKVDLNTIYNYIDALVSSYVVSKVNRFDLQGKEILKTQEKYYLADQGIQHAIFGYRDRNISGILENIVFNELTSRGFKVFIGRIGDFEIDFVAEKGNNKIYIQVAYKLSDEKTVSREFTPLLMVADHYPKFVVTLDKNFSENIEGVRHLYLVDFLTNKALCE